MKEDKKENSEPAKPLGAVLLQFLPWAIALGALCDAVRLRWLSDDAFISFRYARNFADGHGLVYNQGEWVEGYTNLLWTVLLSLGMTLGIEPEWLSHFLSISAYAGSLWLMWQVSAKGELPTAMFIVASMFHMRVFATSGLETMSFIFLVSLATVGIWEGSLRKVGIASVLGILTRPEGILLWMCSVFALRDSGKTKTVGGLGFLTLLILTTWRWQAYGELVPNTFYAKAAQSNWSLGVLYCSIFIGMYWFLLLSIPAIAHLIKGKEPSHRLALFASSFLSLYMIHVLRAGGDFMVARFCLPWVPVLAVTISIYLEERFPWKVFPILIGTLALTAIYPKELLRQQDGEIGIEGITEEMHWYPEYWRAKAEEQGLALRPFFEDSEAKVVIYGAQAMFAYYARLPYVLEGMSGLTDKELARRPSRSKRMGHGRKADVDYLQERGIDLYIDFRISQGVAPFNEISFGTVQGSILSYRPHVLQKFREKGAQFSDFSLFLDNYLSNAHRMKPDQVSRDYAQFNSYYFRHNDDPREEQLLSLISTFD